MRSDESSSIMNEPEPKAEEIKESDSMRTGVTFGMTSAVITTLGLMVGLHSGTHSRMVVLGGIITIAVADAFSDALGIHVSEESESVHTVKQIWMSTIFTFFTKFFFALSFAAPVLFLPLATAIIVSMFWGMAVLAILSYLIAKAQGKPALKMIGEHILIALVVIAVTHLVGHWVGNFGK